MGPRGFWFQLDWKVWGLGFLVGMNAQVFNVSCRIGPVQIGWDMETK